METENYDAKQLYRRIQETYEAIRERVARIEAIEASGNERSEAAFYSFNVYGEVETYNGLGAFIEYHYDWGMRQSVYIFNCGETEVVTTSRDANPVETWVSIALRELSKLYSKELSEQEDI